MHWRKGTKLRKKNLTQKRKVVGLGDKSKKRNLSKKSGMNKSEKNKMEDIK